MDKLQRLKEIVQVVDKDTASVEEVAVVVKVLVQAIQETQNDSEEKFRMLRDAVENISLTPGPQGKEGRAGKDGRDGRDGRNPIDGVDGLDGKDGEKGDTGPIPKHEWKDTKIRFQNADGTWGKWVDLQGKAGMNGFTMFGGGDGAGKFERILSSGVVIREGVSEIDFGANLVVTRTANGVRVDAQGGTGGANLKTEKVTAVQSGSDVTIDLTQLSSPYSVVQWPSRNGIIVDPGPNANFLSTWEQSGDTLTIYNADVGDTFQVQYTY